jgi:hypothetical protein
MEDTKKLEYHGCIKNKDGSLVFNCPCCDEETKVQFSTNAQSFINFNFFFKEKCPNCFCVVSMDLQYIDNSDGYYKINQETYGVIDKMMEKKTFSEFNYLDHDKSDWTEFVLNYCITTNADAIVHTKHKSKKVRDFCWNFLKKDNHLKPTEVPDIKRIMALIDERNNEKKDWLE